MLTIDTSRWVKWIRSSVTSPHRAYEVRWATQTPTRTALENQLDDAYERVVSESGRIEWVAKNRFVPNERFSITNENEVRVERWLHGSIQSLFVALVVFAPFLLTTVWSLPGYLAALVLLEGKHNTDAPVSVCTEIVFENKSGFVSVMGLLALATVINHLLSITDYWPVLVFCAVAVGIQLMLFYLSDELPFVRPDLAKRPMAIPYSMAITSFGTTLLFFPAVLAATYVARLGAVLSTYAVGETSRGTASILSDFTGGQTAAPETLSPAVVREAVFQIATPLFTLVFLCALVMFGLWVWDCRYTTSVLHDYRLTPFESATQRFGTFVGFVIFSGVIYAVTAVAISILLFGITGTYYLPSSTLQPLLVILPAELTTSVHGFLTSMYETLDHAFAAFPGSARLGSLIFLSGLLWPFVFVAVGTVTEILGRPYRALRVLARSTPLTDDAGQSLVPPDVQVRRISCDGYPDIRPLSLLFGVRNYIIVSDIVVSECSRDELQALLQHELYHIRERRLGYATVMLSSFLGGANALPAFFDYRKSERNADAAAAAVVGAKTVRHAIRRMYSLRARTTPNTIGLQHPGIIGSESFSMRYQRLTSDAASRVALLRAHAQMFVAAPYKLYFGSILVDTAHMDKDERLAALFEE